MNNEINKSSLPMMALDSIPTPNPDAKQITGLVKERGKIIGYELNNSEKLDKQSAINLAKSGGIKGVGIAHRNSTEYLKSIPDGTENNNLSSLPTVN